MRVLREDSTLTGYEMGTLREVDALIEAAADCRAEPERALALARRALMLAEALERPDGMIRALLAESDAHYFGGGVDAAAQSAEAAARARELAVETEDSRAEIESLTRLMRVSNQEGAVSMALLYSRQRLALARQLSEAGADDDAAQVLAKALAGAAAVHIGGGDYLTAGSFLAESLFLSRKIGDVRTEVIALSNIGMIQDGAGQHSEAAAVFAEAAQRHASLPRGHAAQIKALSNQAECLLNAGRYSEGESVCEEALAVIQASGIRQMEPRIRLILGQLQRRQGRTAEASAILEAGAAQSAAAGEGQALCLLRAELGSLASAEGNHARAIDLLEEALRLSGERLPERREIYKLLAEAAEAAGNPAMALRYYKEFHDLSERLQLIAADRRIALRLASLEVERAEQQAHLARQEAEAMRRSNAVLQEFAAVASHDLKEPLRKILAFGGMLRSKLDKLGAVVPPEAKDYLNRITAATGRMQALIDGLLELARASQQSGSDSRDRRERVNLAAIAEDVVSDLEVRLIGTGGQVRVGDLPTVLADPLQMRQLLQNLIGNALKFHREEVPPLVRVEGETRDGRLTLRVIDNGIGFAPEHAQRIFGAFERVAGRGYEGTGVGLAICQRIVEAHGGTITAEGKPGDGATFIVTLPQQGTALPPL